MIKISFKNLRKHLKLIASLCLSAMGKIIKWKIIKWLALTIFDYICSTECGWEHFARGLSENRGKKGIPAPSGMTGLLLQITVMLVII